MIRAVMLCAVAQSIELIRKIAMLAVRTTLRPKMSERRPYKGWQEVEAKRYAVPTHEVIVVL
jgi:hypothetical protein